MHRNLPDSDTCEEGAVRVDETVGHARSVEAEAEFAILVEENEAAGAFAALREELHGSLRSSRGRGACRAKEVARGFGQNHLHDRFTVARG